MVCSTSEQISAAWWMPRPVLAGRSPTGLRWASRSSARRAFSSTSSSSVGGTAGPPSSVGRWVAANSAVRRRPAPATHLGDRQLSASGRRIRRPEADNLRRGLLLEAELRGVDRAVGELDHQGPALAGPRLLGLPDVLVPVTTNRVRQLGRAGVHGL